MSLHKWFIRTLHASNTLVCIPITYEILKYDNDYHCLYNVSQFTRYGSVLHFYRALSPKGLDHNHS